MRKLLAEIEKLQAEIKETESADSRYSRPQ